MQPNYVKSPPWPNANRFRTRDYFIWMEVVSITYVFSSYLKLGWDPCSEQLEISYNHSCTYQTCEGAQNEYRHRWWRTKTYIDIEIWEVFNFFAKFCCTALLAWDWVQWFPLNQETRELTSTENNGCPARKIVKQSDLESSDKSMRFMRFITS